MRLLAKLVVGLAFVAGSVTAVPAGAAVPPFTDTITNAYLSNPHTGMVIDVSGARRDATAPIWTWPFHGELNQQWAVTRVGATQYYTIAALHSGLCLDVANGNWNNGTRVWQWSCHGGDAQLWKPEVFAVDAYGYSTFRLRNKGSNRCLEIPGGVNLHGAVLAIWECHAGRNQEWRQGNFLSNPSRAHVADISGWNRATGTQGRMWTFHGGANQELFKTVAPGSPAWRFEFFHSGHCLGLLQRRSDNGIAVGQVACDLEDRFQWWLPLLSGLDRFGQPVRQFRNVATGKCLDIWVHDQPVGARLLQWDCHSGWNQQWRFA
ncbi:RICIN domain-containing protein [Lentzea sp. NPDC005914]|uniref:RICIN domain-containing protein n=1 Tax=Lentzea sp. NPDC005914 TaxID=3154572 RepID=UPI0033E69311